MGDRGHSRAGVLACALGAFALIGGCGKGERQSDEVVVETPLRVELGECAAAETPFESRPRPQPFASPAGAMGWGTVGKAQYGTIGHGADTPPAATAPPPLPRRATASTEGRDAPEAAAEAGLLGPVGDDRGLEEVLAGGFVSRTAPVRVPSPLAASKEALRACLGQPPAARGVLVIDLARDDEGGVRAVAVGPGVTDEVARCVAQVGRAVTLPGDGAGLRCPLAFGATPEATLPAIAITAEAITLGEQVVATMGAIATDASPSLRIDDLYERLRTERPAAEPLVVIEPVAVRPADDTPMRVIYRVVYSAAAAGADPLLAARDGAGWRFLHDLALPALPAPVEPPVRHAERPPVASILIEEDAVWIGVEPGDRQRLSMRDGAHDLAALEAALGELREGGALRDRADLEIAATDRVPYRALVAVADVARKAGFSDWALINADSTSVRFTE